MSELRRVMLDRRSPECPNADSAWARATTRLCVCHANAVCPYVPERADGEET